MSKAEFSKQFRADRKFRLANCDPRWVDSEFKALRKEEIKEQARRLLDRNLRELSSAQELLYADNRYALLLVIQGMDASGKDGLIKHVMSGVNPQGCQAFSFKKPTPEEHDHNFLWRYWRCLPERGRIGIFNRSYYEDVVATRVHPEWLGPLPGGDVDDKFWERRYEDVNAFERHLVRNGTIVLKFFLHVSKGEQRRRLLERLDKPVKNWKFNPADLQERRHWDEYMRCYERAIRATSTNWAPWHIVPADHKWVARVATAQIICEALAALQLAYPKPTAEQARQLRESRKLLTK
jgi:PPK2 family polyphosphate:nucleotide phosphotransferase